MVLLYWAAHLLQPQQGSGLLWLSLLLFQALGTLSIGRTSYWEGIGHNQFKIPRATLSSKGWAGNGFVLWHKGPAARSSRQAGCGRLELARNLSLIAWFGHSSCIDSLRHLLYPCSVGTSFCHWLHPFQLLVKERCPSCGTCYSI